MASSSSLTLPKFLTSLLPSTSPPPSVVSLPMTASAGSPTATTGGPTPCIAAVAFPSLANSNTLFFKSAYNVQVIPEQNEPEERLLNRFRKEVFRAGVLQECRRRRFFENAQEKRKRKSKSREAARRNRKRPPPPKAPTKGKHKSTYSKKDDDKDDNWDHFDVELPY